MAKSGSGTGLTQTKLDPRLLQGTQPSTLLSTKPSVGAGFYSHSKQQTRPASESSNLAPFCSHEATLCSFLARGCSRGGQPAPGHVHPLRAADELARTRAELGNELQGTPECCWLVANAMGAPCTKAAHNTTHRSAAPGTEAERGTGTAALSPGATEGAVRTIRTQDLGGTGRASSQTDSASSQRDCQLPQHAEVAARPLNDLPVTPVPTDRGGSHSPRARPAQP